MTTIKVTAIHIIVKVKVEFCLCLTWICMGECRHFSIQFSTSGLAANAASFTPRQIYRHHHGWAPEPVWTLRRKENSLGPFWESANISVVRAAAFESVGRFVAVAQPRSLGPFYITSYIKAYLGSKQLSCAVEQHSRNVRIFTWIRRCWQ
jgi:hypothetical protein